MVEKKMHVLDFFLKGLDADVQRDIHHHLKVEKIKQGCMYERGNANV